MIYDTFLFFDELELLDIRLHELGETVDRFVIVEAIRTFTNKPKPLYYAENKARYKSFSDRIIHIVVEDSPQTSDAWTIEKFQRNCCLRGLSNCKPDDIIILSDVDEIPRASVIPEAVNVLRNLKTPLWNMFRPLLLELCEMRYFRRLLRKHHPRVFKFHQTMYLYYLNCVGVNITDWCGTRMVQYKDITSPEEIRHTGRIRIENGGWHFSYMGGADRIIHKLAAYSHQELNTPKNNDLQWIDDMIQNGRLFFDESIEIRCEELNETYPQFILDNREKFDSWIKQC